MIHQTENRIKLAKLNKEYGYDAHGLALCMV